MKLKTYRKQLGLSREKVAAALGVTGVTVWRWETGRMVPSPPVLKKIAKWSAGAVTPNDFMGVTAS